MPIHPVGATVSRFSAHGLLADLEALVVRESPSDDASAVTALAHDIVERLRAAHVQAETRPARRAATPCSPWLARARAVRSSSATTTRSGPGERSRPFPFASRTAGCAGRESST